MADPLDYAGPSTERPRRTPLLGWLALVIVGALLVGAMLPGGHSLHSRAASNNVKCGANLKLIGQAMLTYASLHQGYFPDRIGELQAQGIPLSAFVCPESNDEDAPPGATTQGTADNIEAGRHLSYIYLGKGMTFTGRTDVVLVYEPLNNHGGRGMNILFGDDHVEWFKTGRANWLLGELSSGHNPPRFNMAPKP